jgi:hypothetical protein
MENEERAQLEVHYQNEIESIKGEVARLRYMLEQVLSSKNGKGIFAQPPVKTPSIHVPHTSQNLEADSITGNHFVPFTVVYPSQAQITVNPTMKGPSDNRFTNPTGHDKWVALEERLRVVEGNNLIHPVITAEVCLVPNIVVPNEFRVPDFVKYTGLECPYTHLRSYYNKMAEMIHNDKMLIYFFQDSLTGSALNVHTPISGHTTTRWLK